MGFLSNFMSSSKTLSLFVLLLLLSVPKTNQKDQGFFSVLVSNKGLDFAKDVILQKAVSSIIPLKLPQIEKRVEVPLLGNFDVVLSNLTINGVDLPGSFVESGETGVVLVVPNATAKLSMNWSYLYNSWFLEISDHGSASIEVQGLSVGVTVAMEDQEGALKLSVLDSGCYVSTLIINLDGGSSWLYQGFIDAFEDPIVSRVEDSISKKIEEGVSKLDSLLQSLPRQIKVYKYAAMNVTFVGNPVLTDSSIEFDIDGLFVATEDSVPRFYQEVPVDYLVPSNPSVKMVEISLHEKIFNSVSSVFFNAGYFRWIIDKVADQSFLNTSKWRLIIPKLYKKYPNEAMNLNVSVTSPPIIKVSEQDIDVTIYADVTVGVLDAGEAVPVLCIAFEISASCTPKMAGNKLVGTLKLRDFKMSLRWSKVGYLHMHILQSVMSTILKRFVIPYANAHLWKGLPLPILGGFTLRNAEISFTDLKLVISSDVALAEQFKSLSKYLL